LWYNEIASVAEYRGADMADKILSIAESAMKHFSRDGITIEDIVYIIENPVLVRIEETEPYLKTVVSGI
jgi:hypothetical protein